MGAREVPPEAIAEAGEAVAEKIDVLLDRATGPPDTVLGVALSPTRMHGSRRGRRVTPMPAAPYSHTEPG